LDNNMAKPANLEKKPGTRSRSASGDRPCIIVIPPRLGNCEFDADSVPIDRGTRLLAPAGVEARFGPLGRSAVIPEWRR
jgi:hypothetical protein